MTKVSIMRSFWQNSLVVMTASLLLGVPVQSGAAVLTMGGTAIFWSEMRVSITPGLTLSYAATPLETYLTAHAESPYSSKFTELQEFGWGGWSSHAFLGGSGFATSAYADSLSITADSPGVLMALILSESNHSGAVEAAVSSQQTLSFRAAGAGTVIFEVPYQFEIHTYATLKPEYVYANAEATMRLSHGSQILDIASEQETYFKVSPGSHDDSGSGVLSVSASFTDGQGGILWMESAASGRATSPVPEPGTLLLIGIGIGGMAILFRRGRE